MDIGHGGGPLSRWVTLFFNGIIAIYIGTIFLEVKRRPVIVREVVTNRASDALRHRARSVFPRHP